MLDILKKRLPESIKRPLRRLPKKTVNFLKDPIRTWQESRIRKNVWFAYAHRHLRRKCKIIHALTPPSYWKNVGDHAQVIAIRAWLKKHFPKLPVIEVDKDEVKYYLPALRWLIQPDDMIFLQSGGNLGDRGIWSESGRRLLISTFLRNQIISLPVTIYFSDTPTGIKEREISRQIYATHPNLTIIARDPVSDELARELFPKAWVFCMPDFTLLLPPRPSDSRNDPPKVLLCLRADDESVLAEKQYKDLGDCLPYQNTYFNTIYDKPIYNGDQEIVLERTLESFRASDVVVTDRFHGLIFSILCQKPCVVLRTVDHKLTSARHWFKDIPFVMFAQDLDEIPSLVERCLTIKSRQIPDWNEIYFDKIPELIGLK